MGCPFLFYAEYFDLAPDNRNNSAMTFINKLSLVFLISIFAIIFIACNEKPKAIQEDPAHSGVKATGPRTEPGAEELAKVQMSLELNYDNLSGRWIMKSYVIEEYKFYQGMNENQKKNFTKILENLIGVLEFVFSKEGKYTAKTGLPFTVEGNWFLDESGRNLIVNQENEVENDKKRPVPKTSRYTINKLTENYLTMTDTDGLTFIFEKE